LNGWTATNQACRSAQPSERQDQRKLIGVEAMPGLYGMVSLHPHEPCDPEFMGCILSSMGRRLAHRDDYRVDR
jgi:hypothetical protein